MLYIYCIYYHTICLYTVVSADYMVNFLNKYLVDKNILLVHSQIYYTIGVDTVGVVSSVTACEPLEVDGDAFFK